MQVIRTIMMMVTVVFGLTLSMSASVAACGVTEQECNRNSAGVVFQGNVQIKNPVKVLICHGYWDRLDIGTYRGVKTRWWGPVMVYHNWYGDLPIATNKCKTYWVRPGTEMRVFASCVDRVISTGVMRKPGTYIMN